MKQRETTKITVCFALIQIEAKLIKRNKAKQNKLRSETTKNGLWFSFDFKFSKNIYAKQSETKQITKRNFAK